MKNGTNQDKIGGYEKSDFVYFIEKIEENANNPEEVKKYCKRIKLMLDALIVYRLTFKGEV